MELRIGNTAYTPLGFARRAEKLKRVYKLSVDQYNTMYDAQGGVCACCKNSSYTKQLAVDHCHTSGKIRALLCHQCNNNLGIYEKWGDMYRHYLEKFNDSV